MSPTETADRSLTPLSPAVFVTGKGGVGKTTVAAGLAIAAVQSGQGAVFVEFGDGDSGERAFGKLPKNLKHVVLDPQQAILTAAAPLFGSATLAKLALGNFAMRPLIQSAPAIREIAVLEMVRRVVEEHPRRRVVIDMPATGHSVAWLRVAQQGRDLTKRGPIHDLCARVHRELIHPERSSVVVVTLPQPLVMNETIKLCGAIEREVGLRVDRLVVNHVPAMPPPDALSDALRVADELGVVATAAGELGALLTKRAATALAVDKALSQAAGERTATLTRLPLSPADPTARQVARWLTERGAA